MYIILVYDVHTKRVGKVLKKARQYLHWVQNSVLEGEVTEASYRKLKNDLEKIVDTEEDSLLFYVLKSEKYTQRELIGIQKGGERWFL